MSIPEQTITNACARWEAVHDYVLSAGRRLTEPERRAFLYVLDMEMDHDVKHADDCICMEIMPIVVDALEPEPVTSAIAERTIEDGRPDHIKFRAEQHGSLFGVVLEKKSRKEHTENLIALGQGLIDEFAKIVRAIERRKDFVGLGKDQDVFKSCFSDFLRLAHPTIESPIEEAIKSTPEPIKPTERKAYMSSEIGEIEKSFREYQRLGSVLEKAILEEKDKLIKDCDRKLQMLKMLNEYESPPPTDNDANCQDENAAASEAIPGNSLANGGIIKNIVFDSLDKWRTVAQVVELTGLKYPQVSGVLSSKRNRQHIMIRTFNGSKEYIATKNTNGK